MKRIRTALLFTLITLSLTVMPLFAEEEQAPSPSDGSYHLEQVVVLSRHNIRAPLSNSGSAVGQLTPHAWTEWTAPDSELTLKGGVAETIMGQYFRKWLESEQLIPENYIPEDGEVRFYTNARQRTIATAQYFSSGMLPVANVPIEYKDEIGATDPTFKVLLTYMSNAYAEAVDEQLHEQFVRHLDCHVSHLLLPDARRTTLPPSASTFGHTGQTQRPPSVIRMAFSSPYPETVVPTPR